MGNKTNKQGSNKVAGLTTTEFFIAKSKIDKALERGQIDSWEHMKYTLFLDRSINIRTEVIGMVKQGTILPSEARKVEAEKIYF